MRKIFVFVIYKSGSICIYSIALIKESHCTPFTQKNIKTLNNFLLLRTNVLLINKVK